MPVCVCVCGVFVCLCVCVCVCVCGVCFACVCACSRSDTSTQTGAWRQSGDLYNEIEMVNFLPPNVQKLFFEHLAIVGVCQVPLLKGFDSDVVGQIFIMLQRMHFQKREFIYNGEDPGGSMYFVIGGHVCVTGYQGFSLLDDLHKSSVYRPQDLMKPRNLQPDSVESFFGHTALFHEVCKLRVDVAEAKSNVETLCLTRAMLDKIRGFCPDFYEKMFDFCLLTASRYGIINRNIVFQPRHAHARTYPKIDQFCVELRQQLMSQHKEFLTRKIIGLQEQGCADASPTGPPNAGRYIGTEVNERSIEHQKKASAQSPSKLIDSEFLMCSLGMFKQNLPSRDESPSWKSGSLCVAKNLDVWHIINKMDNLIESTPMCMGSLIINQEDFRKTCEIWRLDTSDSDSRPLVTKGKIERCGLVKKRGQVRATFSPSFLLLSP